MPDFRGLGTQVNNVLGSFPEVPYFRFDEYNWKKSEAGTFVKIRPAYYTSAVAKLKYLFDLKEMS